MKPYSIITLLTFTLTGLVLLIGHGDSAKIVCIFPTASKSHVMGPQALLKELARRGHEVTMVSAFPLKHPPKNYRDVYIPIEESFSSIMSNFMQGGSRNMMKLFPQIISAAQESSNRTINAPEFLRLTREEQQFDLAIVGYFMNGFVIGVGELFRCPTILYFSAAGSGLTNVVGNPVEVAAVPHMLLGHRNPMTFLDRTANLILYWVEKVMLLYIHHKELPYYEFNFPANKGFRSYDEALRNVSLVLLNTYFTQTVPRPYLTNMVEVGGLQINQNPEVLPENLQQFLDDADEGAIFLSFGSNLRSSNLRKDKLEAILSTIRRLKQRVVWTWDQDELPNKPDNVFIGKWLPQDSILAHPNMRLFITHGGLGSITEAMYHGVPIVGIPMFGDQDGNVAQVVREGWGVSVNFDELSESVLTDAILKVLENPSYRGHIHTRAILYKDRPMASMETAVFWVEYVIRHHGAQHLHYQGADLNMLQSALLDVYAFLGAALFVVCKVVAFLIRKIKNSKTTNQESTVLTKKKK